VIPGQKEDNSSKDGKKVPYCIRLKGSYWMQFPLNFKEIFSSKQEGFFPRRKKA
jgi:hypothetical protein